MTFVNLINQYLTGLENNRLFAGTVLISKNDKVVFHEGYGKASIEHDIDNNTNTVFKIGSITKTFTAIAILQLAEQGQISLYEPISTHFPNQTGSEIITIHHLLTHSSGISEYINSLQEAELKSWLGSGWSQTDIVNRFSCKPLAFEPGTQFSYCNSGYFLLGLIIEQVTGLTLESYFKKNIFLPANMQSTYMNEPTKNVMQQAFGYEVNQEGLLLNAPYINMNNTFAAGAILSTARDINNFQEALRSNILLSEQSRQLMQIPHIDASDYQYGYGLVIQKSPYGKITGHSGGIHGFCSIYLHYVDADLTVIVLSNIFRPVDDISRRIAELILKND